MQNHVPVVNRPNSAPVGVRSSPRTPLDISQRCEKSRIWGRLRALPESPKSAPIRSRRRLLSRPAAFALIALLFLPPVHADTLVGKVVRILDGDTVEVLDAQKRTHRVRLSAIDAPELKQPFGAKAKRVLSDLVAGETLTIEWHKRDRYDRLIGKLVLDGVDVNLALVRAGYAHWYRAFAGEQSPHDRRLYEAAETAARSEGAGLWSDPRPTPPWEWRGGKTAGSPSAPSIGACPCDSGRTCTGTRGGIYCVRVSGTKKYFPRD